MDTFNTSNGNQVRMRETGALGVSVAKNSLHDWCIGPEGVADLREFFQAERDGQMGVWRSPFVAGKYARRLTENRVRIVDEATDRSRTFLREGVNASNEFSDLAKHYFKAHPTYRPWHDAVAGEIWAVTWGERETACRVVENAASGSGLVFDDSERATPGTHAPVIKTARRIWPEARGEN